MNPVKTIQVKTAPAYDVRIYHAPRRSLIDDAIPAPLSAQILAAKTAEGTAREICAFLREQQADGASLPRLFVLTDENVDQLYGKPFMDALRNEQFEAVRLVLPAGEPTKQMQYYAEGLECLAENGFTRSDILIALGGGVIGDLGGFLAATYLRGIRYIQVPTTLLACVDSSVGGKTAIDLKAGKNLAGAFHQPILVMICEGFLSTLSEGILLDGLAEAIKCGMIGDLSLFEELESLFLPNRPNAISPGTEGAVKQRFLEPYVLTRVITASIELKQRLVEEDERDTGARQLLNFGHTLGHAIEGASGYTVTHGHAVASGMYLCGRASYRFGWSFKDYGERIGALLSALGYQLVYPYDGDTLYTYTMKDKKRMADTITLVVPVIAGRCELKKIPVDQLKDFIGAALSR